MYHYDEKIPQKNDYLDENRNLEMNLWLIIFNKMYSCYIIRKLESW